MADSPNINSALAAWMARRQQALETGIDALKRMSACKTPVEMALIYSEWLSGSMTRILADFEDGQAHAVKMAEHFQTASKTLVASPQAVPAEPAAPAEPPAPHQLREAA